MLICTHSKVYALCLCTLTLAFAHSNFASISSILCAILPIHHFNIPPVHTLPGATVVAAASALATIITTTIPITATTTANITISTTVAAAFVASAAACPLNI